MPPPFEPTRSLLQRLRAAWSGRQPAQAPSSAQPVAIQIGEPLDLSSIPALLNFLSGHDPAIEESAARGIDHIVASADPLSLARLDSTVRRASEWQWPVLRADEVRQASRGLAGPLGVLSFNAHGHVREAAVRALADVRDGRELPFLLIRLNDWVQAVRDLARAAVVERIRPDYAAHFVRCLPLVERLRGQGRYDHGPVHDAVMSLLRAEQSRPALHQALRGGDRAVRRLAFRILALQPGDDQLAVLADGSASDDTVIRLWAARELRTRLEGEPLREALHRFRRDRFMPVRREGLYGFAERLPDEAPAELRDALLDPHPSMRDLARYHLRQSGEDFAAFYRTRLDVGLADELLAAVAGLGETGGAHDAERLAGFFNHPAPRVRRAAVRGVGRLGAEAHLERLLTALLDASPTVASEAAAAVRRHLYLVPPSRLWSLFQAAGCRRYPLRLIAELQWWDATPLLLAATGFHDAATADLARSLLRPPPGNVMSARPRPEQLNRLEEALARHGDRINRSLRDAIASLLAYANRQVR